MKALLILSLLILTACGSSESSRDPDQSNPQDRPREMSLDQIHASPDDITVSGVSSGAYMATQLAFAYPELFRGVGSIAGGPRGCAQGTAWIATTDCMESPAQINVARLVQSTRDDADSGRIGRLDLLQTTRVFLLNSDHDTVIRPPMAAQVKSFYLNFVTPDHLKTVDTVHSEHGLPTLLTDEPCSKLNAPFLMNCNYDSAGEMLQFLLGASSPALSRRAADPASLYELDFANFHEPYSFFSEKALVYIPRACFSKRCRLHVALHGCSQGSEVVKTIFAVKAGYNEWAEGSDLIVLYPQIDSSLVNPKGCFDWFGYTGFNYDEREAPQMKSIAKAVRWFTRP